MIITKSTLDINRFQMILNESEKEKKQPLTSGNCSDMHSQASVLFEAGMGSQGGHVTLLLDINNLTKHHQTSSLRGEDKLRQNTSKFCLSPNKKIRSPCILQNAKHPPLLANMSDCCFFTSQNFSLLLQPNLF